MAKLLISKRLWLVGFCFVHLLLHAQQHTVTTLKKWELIDYAESAVLQKDAYSASIFYAELIKRNPNKVEYKLVYARLQLQLRAYQKALDLFEQLVEKHPSLDEAHYYLSVCYIYLERYDEAKRILSDLKRKHRQSKLNEDLIELVEKELDKCKYALSLQDSVSHYKVHILDETINNQHIDFNPFLLDDSTLVYGSSTEQVIDFYRSETEQPRRHFYTSKFVNDKWKKSQLADSPFFNFIDSHTGDGCFSLDNKRFYFSKSITNTQQQLVHHIYVSENICGVWSEPIHLPCDINLSGYSSFSPTIGTCYNPSLEVLYFISDREGGQGKNDIWYTVYDVTKQTYSECVNAGVFVNTSETEASPYYDHSTHTLYFSSDGWLSMGSLDIFSTTGELTNWSEPVNMGLGINSGSDDLEFYAARKGNSGFFCSNRPSAINMNHNTAFDNIYSWATQGAKKQMVSGQIKSEQYKVNFIAGSELLQTDSVQPLSKMILNVYLKNDTNDYMFVDKIYTDSVGNFEYLVPHGHQLKLVIDSDYVLNKEIKVAATANFSLDEQIVLTTQTVKTIPKENFVVRNIYYETNKYKLDEDSKRIIVQTLFKLLTEYPNLMLDVIAHTDDVGSRHYNQRLSQRRANSVVDFLIEKGINKARLKAIGKGETEPCLPIKLNDNDSVRSQNRRTEFKLYQPNANL